MSEIRYCLGFLVSDHEVLLIRKKRPVWQEGLLNGIGGKVDAFEHPLNAMVREMREETGIYTYPHEWRQFAVMEGGNWIC